MVVAIIVLVVAVVAVTLLVGFTATATLNTYRAEVGEAISAYDTDLAELRRALATVVEASHGMRVIDQDDNALLVSTYPTPLHLYGSFGLFVRCRFRSQSGATHVVMDAAPKVGWASVRMSASLAEFELVIRKALRSRMGVEARVDYGDGSAMRGAALAGEPDAPVVARGWYADPNDPSLVRWWDGTTWTDHVRAPHS